MNTSGNCIQVVNTGAPAIHVAGPFGFSKVVDTRFYFLVNKTQLWQGDITSDSTFTQTELFDLTGATGPGLSQCPGVNWSTFGTPSSASIMGISQTDGRFAWSVGPGGQGTADWGFVWDRTLGCASVDLATASGNYWNFCLSGCSSSTPPSGTLSTASGTCWGSNGSASPAHGIHDSQLSGDGTVMIFTISAGGTAWSQGSCSGSTQANQQTVWTIGTATTQWASDNTSGPGGWQSGSHYSVGVSNYVATNDTAGPNIRPISNVTAFTPFLTAYPASVGDTHSTWIHPLNDDSYPWIGASDEVPVAQGGPIAPNYLGNVVFAQFPNVAYPPGKPPALFTHTFSCNQPSATNCPGGGDTGFGAQNSIGFATQKGNYFCWVSTHLQSLGNDNLGNPRDDGFCVHLQ